jgi:hypothetical protein
MRRLKIQRRKEGTEDVEDNSHISVSPSPAAEFAVADADDEESLRT